MRLGNIHGLTSNADTMMMKNSQWGAVAYLAQSNYGSKQTSNADSGVWNNSYFEGNSVETLMKDFRNSVDEYLEFCTANNKQPEKSSFSISLSPEIYNRATLFAYQKGLPLNKYVENILTTSLFS